MQIKFLFHCAKISAASMLIVGLSFAQSSQTATAQRKDGAIRSADYGRVSSARVKSHPNSANNRQQNDSATYQNKGKAITNPVTYKDPEDMTTRSSAGTTHGADGGANAAAHAASKHAAGVKYQNAMATGAAGQPSGSSSSSTETFKQDFGQVQPTKK